ncbi:MAG: PatB family C-S lyase [Chloroflexi bacterium]|nr:PatB family C-S lyase [Chloroflexota bacterium]
MVYNFDEPVERRGSDSGKWHYFGADVLPMWVADMDFRSPAPVMKALHERIDHGVFGYGLDSPELKTVLRERMHRLYNWTITPDDIVFWPGLVCGLNVVSRAIGEREDSVLVNTPVYPPFLSSPINQERTLAIAELALQAQGQQLHYALNDAAFTAAIQANTKLFLLCNPHNPVGRAYTRDELTRMAEMCLRHDLTICSDEIHSDLLLGGAGHIPIAALAPEIAARTVTILAPSKTYNLPGLGCSMAIIQDPALRRQVQKAANGIVPHVNVLGYVAAIAAYTECEDWLDQLRTYLTGNRDFLVAYVKEHLPTLRTTVPEATYLAWLDCREAGIEGNAQKFFLEKAKVALNDGAAFGTDGAGFVRLNFGCTRATLQEGLEKMRAALESIQ